MPGAKTSGIVVASMATIPERAESFRRAAESLLDQVDILAVYFNGHKIGQVPEWSLSHPRIELTGTPYGLPDLGDGGKFYWSGSLIAPWYLFCDDDLQYPPNYVETMIEAIERYDRKAAVGIHGSLLKTPLGRNLQTSRSKVLHFSEARSTDHAVHILGTGCMAYHRSTIRFGLESVQSPNMADAWFALGCQLLQVPRVVIEHPAGWVKQLPYKGCIWTRNCHSEAPMNVLRRSESWDLVRPAT